MRSNYWTRFLVVCKNWLAAAHPIINTTTKSSSSLPWHGCIIPGSSEFQIFDPLSSTPDHPASIQNISWSNLAIKQLDSVGSQGIREFVVEMMTLSLVDHPNLVNLVGYCVEAGQKLLVYEYTSLGSLEGHLHGPNRKGLDWNIRMKIAAGTARGLEYPHGKMNPPIIYHDLKCSNLLHGEGYHPKLSDFGLAKVGPTGNNTHISTRVMGTYGYCAPEYAMTGHLTFKVRHL